MALDQIFTLERREHRHLVTSLLEHSCILNECHMLETVACFVCSPRVPFLMSHHSSQYYTHTTSSLVCSSRLTCVYSTVMIFRLTFLSGCPLFTHTHVTCAHAQRTIPNPLSNITILKFYLLCAYP